MEPGNNIQYAGVRTPTDVYIAHASGEKEYDPLFGNTLCAREEDPYQTRSRHHFSCYAARRATLQEKLNLLRSCAGAGCRSAEQ